MVLLSLDDCIFFCTINSFNYCNFECPLKIRLNCVIIYLLFASHLILIKCQGNSIIELLFKIIKTLKTFLKCAFNNTVENSNNCSLSIDFTNRDY